MKIFKHLEFKQLKILIDIVSDTKKNDIDFIKMKYNRLSDNFINVKSFLSQLKLIKEDGSKLSLSKKLLNLDKKVDDKAKLYIEVLVQEIFKPNKLRKELKSYFDKFEPINDTYVYSPSTSQRLKESGIRNFFIDLGVVEYFPDKNSYHITDNYITTYLSFLDSIKISPKQLKAIQKNKEILGESAELCIMEYERKKLLKYPKLVKKIIHIALEDVSAGYDIQSWSIDKKGKNKELMYIEVKAISNVKKRFYWSKNEIKKAKATKNRYYLYLIPVIDSNTFDIKNLEIIQNPADKLLSDSSNWDKEVETYSFTKK